MGFAKPFRKVTTDMSRVLISWAAWFVAIVIALYFVTTYIMGGDVKANNQLNELVMRILDRQWGAESVQSDIQGFVSFIFHPSKIFMLVIGISNLSFLTFFVKQGVTRKDYFIGAILSSIVVSLTITVVSIIAFVVEGAFIANVSLQYEGMWGLLLILHILNLLIYFTIGWLIGAGFYRYGGGGILFILLAVSVAFVFEALWTMQMALATLGTLVLLVVLWYVLRQLTKRVRVKLK